jgi:hypothetical protein
VFPPMGHRRHLTGALSTKARAAKDAARSLPAMLLRAQAAQMLGAW